MSTIDTGGPAFPKTGRANDERRVEEEQIGMSLRDYFAAKALAGMLADSNVLLGGERNDKLAVLAYEVADAMLRARGTA